MKTFTFYLFLIVSTVAFSQDKISLNTIGQDIEYENIHSQTLFENEYASYYYIWIKQSVASHKHVNHTESISVIDGEGVMTIDGKNFHIQKGDFFVIPKNTFHSLKVTSSDPIKVISIQTPKFNAEDRVFENKK